MFNLVSVFFFFNDTATTEIYTLSLHDALPIYKRRFVGEHVNEPGMRNADKVLVILSAHACLLLPERIFPDNDRSYPLLYQKVNNALAGSMKIVVYLTIPLGGKLLHLPGDTLSLLFGETQLEFFHSLILPLVTDFARSTLFN